MPKLTATILEHLGGPAGASPERVREIMELRLILEPEQAALAALRRTDQDLERLWRNLENQEQAGPDEFPDLDTRMHMLVAKATGNQTLWDVAAMLHDLLSECRAAPLWSQERMRQSVAAHREVIRAIADADPERARQAMRQHLQHVETAAARGNCA